MKNKGFTLVELSIVLVIIGLLIGGILVGQSLISSAKISNSIRQLSQYDIAINNFKEKFKCLPADCENIVYSSGDNDGLIEDQSNDDNSFTNEIANFWNVISTLNYISDGVIYSNNGLSGVQAGIQVPKLHVGKDTGVIVKRGDYYGTGLRNLYFLVAPNNSSHGFGLECCEHPMTVIEAAAIDKKIDDGNGRSGKALVSAANEAHMNISSPTSNTCITSHLTGIYNFNSPDEYPCSLIIDINTLVPN